MEVVFNTLLGPVAGIATAVIAVMVAWNKMANKIAVSESDRIVLHKDIEAVNLRITEHKKEDQERNVTLTQDMVDLKVQLASLIQVVEYLRQSIDRVEKALYRGDRFNHDSK
jgi:hypothetical protein